MRKNNWEIRVEKAVLDLPKTKLGTYGRLAYVVLCGFADRQGRAFPKIDTIADVAACSRASVVKGLHELEALGLIKRSVQVTKKGQCANEYQIFRPSEIGSPGICGRWLGVAPVRQVTEARRKLFEARVSEDVGRQTSSWWREFFGRIAASGSLISNGAGRWLTFDWALDERHFVGIIEGKYSEEARRHG